MKKVLTLAAMVSVFAAPLSADVEEDVALWEAAEKGDVPTLRALLEQGVKPAAVQPGKRHDIAVCAAARRGHLEVVKLLLEAAPDETARATMAEEALHGAAQADDDAVLRYLLENKLGDPTKVLPFCWDAGHSLLLLEAGADIHAGHEYALCIAAYYGNVERVRFLLEHGADATAPTTFGPPGKYGYRSMESKSPLYFMMGGRFNSDPRPSKKESAGKVQVVKLLLEHGADPNDNAQEPALCVLLEDGYFVPADRLEVARLLLDAGADVDARSEDGSTPLHYAASLRNPEALALLLERGANPNVQDSEGCTPLHRILETNPDYTVSLKLLCQHGADLHVKDNQGRTPLDLCREECVSPEFVAILKDMGEDTSGLETPPPDEDVSGGEDEDVFEIEEGDPPATLHVAAARGDIDAIKRFLEAGADVNAKNKLGWTPLHEAAGFLESKAVEFLLSHGANPDAQDNHGYTPLDVARSTTGDDDSQEELVKTLEFLKNAR